MIDFDNRVDEKIDLKNCEKILKYFDDYQIELILTDSNEIKKLNRVYRNIDKPTDVLSFPLEKLPNSPIGSIVINIDKIKQNSNEFSHSLDEEFTLLFLHGFLHLLGYDHENDNGKMRKKEKEIIELFSFPKSLIVRND